jgi:hypothetical protein
VLSVAVSSTFPATALVLNPTATLRVTYNAPYDALPIQSSGRAEWLSCAQPPISRTQHHPIRCCVLPSLA